MDTETRDALPAAAGGGGPYATQPWSEVVWPPSDTTGPTWRLMTPELAVSLPAVSRAVQLISGMCMQMPMDDYRGITPLARPRMLDQPDPDESRAWFVQGHLCDYLLNGNAVNYVTSRDADGWPATAVWLPAAWINVSPDPEDRRRPTYWVGGMRLRNADVVHVKRGASRWNPFRGVGVVEQHMDALGIVDDQQRYQRELLEGAAMPSVAVIAPNPRLGQDEADAAKLSWLEKYAGPVREPAILPAGTQVIPLAWSPSDSQLIEARTFSLTDVANIFNLDTYWTGAPASSHTYRSPGPMYLNLLRQTVEPILSVIEDVWSACWLPRGRRVRFDRKVVLTDDMQTTVQTLSLAVRSGLMSNEEARTYMGLPPLLPGAPPPTESVSVISPVDTVPTDDTTPPTDGGQNNE